MKIQCRKCGFVENTNLGLFVKIIGGAAPVGGFWAWTAYLFAGTGFALPIVVAIITGGVGMLVFKEQIVVWITNKKYQCPKCSASDWETLVGNSMGAAGVAKQPLAPMLPVAPVAPKPGIGTLNLLIVVGGLIWLAYIFFGGSPRVSAALPAQPVEAQTTPSPSKPLPKPTVRTSRNHHRLPVRHANSDLRNCLSLKTDEAVAKCAERPQ